MNKQFDNKKLLVLGGKPIGSYDIVNYANSIGVYTIVTDYLDEKESIAKQISNENWNHSTADTELLSKKITGNNIDAVFTGIHEFNISKALDLCEELGLPFYATRKQMELTSNKHIYKDIFHKHGMPIIPQYFVGNPNELSENIEKYNIDFPVMIKPVDGSGGFGVKICNNETELLENLENTSQHSKSSNILVEKLFNSPEITIFYLIKDGEIKLSIVSDRETYKFNEKEIPLPINYTFPSLRTETYIDKYNNKVIDSFKSMGLQNGMMFLQAFWEDDQCYIYDIGFRLTGTQEYNILSKICGYDPLEMLVDYALTGKMGSDDNVMDKVDPYLNGKYAANMTFLLNQGVISKYIGVEEVRKIKGVERVVLNHNIGYEIQDTAIGTLIQVGLRVFIITDTLDELNKVRDSIRAIIDVIDSNNKSMLIK